MRKEIAKAAAALAMLALVSLAAQAADLYVSPTGAPQGDGSKEKPLDIATALSARSPARPGDTIWLMGGTYEGTIDGNRRVPFELAVSGTAEAPVIVRPVAGEAVHLNGTAAVRSNYAHYIGLEIGDLRWGTPGHRQNTALDVFEGRSAKVINCNIFGGAMGTGIWAPARDFEIYGCLIHDFGSGGQDRGHGHSLYTQNREGTKRIVDTISYRGYGWNLHAYSEGGWVQGYHVEGNIFYSPGTLWDDPPNDNIWFGSRNPMDRIVLVNNVAYHHERGGWRPNVRLTTQRDKNIAGEVRDNTFMGLRGLDVRAWQKMTITGNTVWGPDMVLNVAVDEGDEWTVDNNTYIAKADAPLFGGKTFAAYREATGFDKNSTLIEAERPTGKQTFIRPNHYEKGRANVAIFNWDGLDAIEVDLKEVLAEGQAFRVYNCFDIKQTIALAKPVVEGVFDGRPVSFPMKKDKLSPEFDAFIVLPGN